MKDTKNLYEVLGVSKDVDQAEIKKAYRKLALQLHPDKNPSEEAKEKFQLLQKVYDVLRDPERRKIYDETGSWEGAEEGDLNDAFNFFWRGNPITEDDLLSFEKEYRGSDKEKEELLGYYTRFKGDMEMVYEYLVCSRPEVDSHRFMDCIQQAIDAGEVKKYKKFSSWAKEVEKTPRPADPLKVPQKKKRKKAGDNDMQLVAAIREKRSQNFGSWIQKLGEKYGVGEEELDHPSEEQFAEARSKLTSKASKATGGEKTAKKKGKKA